MPDDLMPSHSPLPTAATQGNDFWQQRSNLTSGTLMEDKPSAFLRNKQAVAKSTPKLKASHYEEIPLPDNTILRVSADSPAYQKGSKQRHDMFVKLHQKFPDAFPPPRDYEAEARAKTGPWSDVPKGFGKNLLEMLKSNVTAGGSGLGAGGMVDVQPSDKPIGEVLKGAFGNLDLKNRLKGLPSAATQGLQQNLAPGATEREQAGSLLSNVPAILSSARGPMDASASIKQGMQRGAAQPPQTPLSLPQIATRGGAPVVIGRSIAQAGMPRLGAAVEAGAIGVQIVARAVKDPKMWQKLLDLTGEGTETSKPPTGSLTSQVPGSGTPPVPPVGPEGPGGALPTSGRGSTGGPQVPPTPQGPQGPPASGGGGTATGARPQPSPFPQQNVPQPGQGPMGGTLKLEAAKPPESEVKPPTGVSETSTTKVTVNKPGEAIAKPTEAPKPAHIDDQFGLSKVTDHEGLIKAGKEIGAWAKTVAARADKFAETGELKFVKMLDPMFQDVADATKKVTKATSLKDHIEATKEFVEKMRRIERTIDSIEKMQALNQLARTEGSSEPAGGGKLKKAPALTADQIVDKANRENKMLETVSRTVGPEAADKLRVQYMNKNWTLEELETEVKKKIDVFLKSKTIGKKPN